MRAVLSSIPVVSAFACCFFRGTSLSALYVDVVSVGALLFLFNVELAKSVSHLKFAKRLTQN